MKRQYTICTEHFIVIKDENNGSCPQCNGDRNLIEVAAIQDMQQHLWCPIHGDNRFINRGRGWRAYGGMCGAVSGYGDVCDIKVEMVFPWKENYGNQQ